jgi:ribosomal protein S18 acetylase RimI-like enzyme
MKPFIEGIWGWDIAWQLEDFERRLQERITLVLESDGELAGYLQLLPQDDHLYLQMLQIHPEFQAKGLGRMALDSLSEKFNGQPIKLRCFKNNTAALEFYAKCHFTQVAEEDNFFVFLRT